MQLEDANLCFDQQQYPLAWCELRGFNPLSGDVRGALRLPPGVSIPKQASDIVLHAGVQFKVQLMVAAEDKGDGVRYRFLATCLPEDAHVLDMMFNAGRHPTMLEEFMNQDPVGQEP